MILVFLSVKVTMMDHKISLIFQLISKTFIIPTGLAETIVELQSKGLLNEKIRLLITSNECLSSKLKCPNCKIRLKYKGSYLKQGKVIFSPNNLLNLFIVYQFDRWSKDLNVDLTLKYYLLIAANKLKTLFQMIIPVPEYSIRFDSCSPFSSPDFDWEKMLLSLE